MRVVVASKNPVKLQAATKAFQTCFNAADLTVEGVSVPSGVSDQPLTDAETLQGALNRAECAAKTMPDAGYWVGLEGGIHETAGDMHSFAWAAVRDSSGRLGKGRTAAFVLPPRVAELVRGGMELGEADDIVFGETNSKQKMGAVGLLTNGLIDRAGLYTPGLIMALIPLLNGDLY